MTSLGRIRPSSRRSGGAWHSRASAKTRLDLVIVIFILSSFPWSDWGMDCVFRTSLCLVSLGVLFACGGCASPGPATPSFAAMPGRGKSYEAFQRDDQYCQSSAQQAIGYQSPGQAANQAAVGTAAVGTALGAVAGAAIGSVSGNGNGCGIGRRLPVVAGSATLDRQRAANGDIALGLTTSENMTTVYAQCMTAAKGNRIGGAARR